MEKQSDTHTHTHTLPHTNLTDAAKGQTAPGGLPGTGPALLCLCHLPGRDLLAKQQPCPGSSSAHIPLCTRSREEAGFSFFPPSLPQNEHSKPQQAAGQIQFACVTDARGSTSVLPSGDGARVTCISGEDSCPQMHRVVWQQGRDHNFSGLNGRLRLYSLSQRCKETG